MTNTDYTLAHASSEGKNSQTDPLAYKECAPEAGVNILSNRHFIQKIPRRLEGWKSFLSNSIGLLSFNFALNCQSSPQNARFLNSVLSLTVVLMLVAKKRLAFPAELRALREKKEKSEEEKRLLGYVEARHFSLKTFIGEYGVYCVGIFYLILNMAYFYIFDVLRLSEGFAKSVG